MMLKTRNQGDDSMFRWARTEMKREIVMSQSSYAKIAGLQSEVGRVAITRVAGSELEYKRTLNMYRKDMTLAVNNIRREQVKMRLKMGRYAKKLKQTKMENAKRLKEERRRDTERAQLEELHIRLKFEAAARTPEPNLVLTDHRDATVSPSDIHFKGPLYLQTGALHEREENFWRTPENDNEHEKDSKSSSKHANKPRNENMPFSPLPMINEDAEKETEEVIVETEENSSLPNSTIPLKDTNIEIKIFDEEMSVSSYGGRRKKKKEVSFSDIMKLKYTGTKHLFDLVHILAKKHGIPDVVEKVPDPRDHIVHRGATNDSDSLRMHAAVLYPMKYGYENKSDNVEHLDTDTSISNPKSPVVTTQIVDVENILFHEEPAEDKDEKPKRWRKLSLEQRRAIYLSGVHSKSVDAITGQSNHHAGSPPTRTESPRKLKSRDNSMPSLVERVAKIKLEQSERISERRNSDVMMAHLLPTSKPSSSRSSRSLPPLSRHSTKSEDKVSWTEAFGLLRAIHSLDNI